MANIVLSQPGGAGVLSASGYGAAGARCYLSFNGSTTSWTWAIVGKPGNSSAALNSTTRSDPSFNTDVEGDYAIKFTDSGGTVYGLNLTVEGTQTFSVRGGVPELQYDRNSLVSGNISLVDWRGTPPDATTVSAFASRGNTGPANYADAVLLNPNGAAASTGEIRAFFSVPVGCTGVDMSIPLAKATAGSTTIKFGIYDNDAATVLGSTIVTVIPTELTYTLQVTGLVSGHLYWAFIQCNNTAQQAVVNVGRVRVRPTVGTPTRTFAGSFLRLRASEAITSGTTLMSQWVSGIYMPTNNAEISVQHNAPTMASEWYNASVATNIAYLVDDRDYKTSDTNGVTNSSVIDDQTLPTWSTTGGSRMWTVRSGVQGTSEVTGAFIRAIYLPFCEFSVRPITTTKVLLMVGDSILQGNNATNLLLQAGVMRVRAQYGGTTVLSAYSGRQFFTDANTTALQKAFAQKLAQVHPAVLWMQLGFNDWFTAAWTAANFGTAYAAFLDFFHTASPETIVVCQSPTVYTNEAALNANSETLPNFRSQISTAASSASRVPWCFYDNGLGALYPTATGLAQDGIHLSTDGQGLYGQAIIKELTTVGMM